jgi:NTP pyrophosphatase (non-canonical NTP hydrolase)
MLGIMPHGRRGHVSRKKLHHGHARMAMVLVISTIDLHKPEFPTVSPMSDSTVTIAELKQWVDDFVDRRDWHQFHAPKNLAMSMAIEAAELMEHFQWISVEASREVAKDPERLAEVGEELADVLCYALAMANELDLDLATTIRQKIAKNEEKYPAEEFKGRYGLNQDS